MPTTRAGLVLLRRAINEDWPVPYDVRKAIVDKLSRDIDQVSDVRRFMGVVEVFAAMRSAADRSTQADRADNLLCVPRGG